MHRKIVKFLVVLFTIFALIIPVAPYVVSASTPEYKFTTIEIPGARSVSVNAISANGDIVGNFDNLTGTALSFSGFLLSNGVFTEFRFPGAFLTVPTGISPSGEVVGYYVDGSTWKAYGFLRTRDGTLTKVHNPANSNTELYCILPDGSILGSSYSSFADNYGFLKVGAQYFGSDVLHDLYFGATPDRAILVGTNYVSPESANAFVIQNGVQTHFDFPGYENETMSAVEDIDTAGKTIVGWFRHTIRTNYSDGHGFIAERKGRDSNNWDITEVVYPGVGVVATRVNGINANGDIVGAYNHADGLGTPNAFAFHGFVATRIKK